MPARLRRAYGTGYLHFITFSCYQRRPLLGAPQCRDLFLRILDETRIRYGIVVAGYVIMPSTCISSCPNPKNPTILSSCRCSSSASPANCWRGSEREIPTLTEVCGTQCCSGAMSGSGASMILSCGTGTSAPKSCATCTRIRCGADWWPRQRNGAGAVTAPTLMMRAGQC